MSVERWVILVLLWLMVIILFIMSVLFNDHKTTKK